MVRRRPVRSEMQRLPRIGRMIMNAHLPRWLVILGGSIAVTRPCLAGDALWQRTAGGDVQGSSLRKTAPAGGNAGGLSAQALGSGDGYLEFGTSDATALKVCGLARPNEGYGYTSIDFALRLATDGSLTVLES